MPLPAWAILNRQIGLEVNKLAQSMLRKTLKGSLASGCGHRRENRGGNQGWYQSRYKGWSRRRGRIESLQVGQIVVGIYLQILLVNPTRIVVDGITDDPPTWNASLA